MKEICGGAPVKQGVLDVSYQENLYEKENNQ